MKIEVNNELISRLQNLALVELNDREKERIKRDIKNILDFFDQINKLDLSNVEPLFHPISTGKLRKDEIIKPLSRDEALSNVKRKEDGFIVGPATYGE
ncbi:MULTISPECIES: Asp-tRNA(Asn) amidotransferase subunit GatC [Sulfurisphaera]|uniref:Glutamyl-tRNA(Gln) amidotransferase subunit C n=3 Tax=Sulfurisphaera TaxID=69655 RepID=GATC_SULTO|nr:MULTISPECIES: Asp-tRNA(Asn) amidotransferase subunit GatC [Sulfurisphaera]Q971U4.1 RecName: Full=Glutamyl-tRNA(Gln) amidotransferase subunit C; Short=Glu-ADT subunit C [Sulfurisphaera tokodaii str. 7]MBB5252526.1 aspartyl-tRNA(Asn)/glutamyl-tRNA(Gln) amidotransferase subunit C [Sulfurisphaera ohwakuensis]QGR17029.1 Asp-tRNA(Asn) amidotransferase subunit GatC [Sulfurisphaera ohwakuensis]BAB66326.1 aspartyl/glutamyl-tRNA(Asn/Gln) amidotransferase subunit GatC [Sulfurisphaera tokodaii str. 7]H